MKYLDTLEKLFKGKNPSIDADMSHGIQGMGVISVVTSAASSAACPVGKVVVVLPGKSSELERTVCGKQRTKEPLSRSHKNLQELLNKSIVLWLD